MKIEFREEDHSYRVDGVLFPSVTQIIASANPEKEKFFKDDAAANFGRAVHKACNLYDKGLLNERTMDKKLVPYLYCWKMFLRQTGFEPTHIELLVCSIKYRFAGTLDYAGILNGKRTIVDIKTGTSVPRDACLQTAAYQIAYNEMFPANKVTQRMAVQLCPSGQPKITPHSDLRDKNVFLSMLSNLNWRKK